MLEPLTDRDLIHAVKHAFATLCDTSAEPQLLWLILDLPYEAPYRSRPSSIQDSTGKRF
jgi:hypothetical protein